MAKKKPSPTTLSRRLQQDLAQAERLLEEGQPEAARELLEDLDHRRPGLAPVLELLVNACHDLNDISAYLITSIGWPALRSFQRTLRFYTGLAAFSTDLAL